jgi:Xaa-Pro dipeptidase
MVNNLNLLDRQAKLSKSIQNNQMDGFVVNPGPSLYYLTGLHFHLSERPVVIIFSLSGVPVIVLPELESAKLGTIEFPFQSFAYGEDPNQWVEAFTHALKAARLNNATIGVEARNLRVLELNLLEQAAKGSKFVAADQTVSTLRMIKDEFEIAAMQKAADIAQEALKATLPSIGVGKTENEIATELTMQLFKHGSNPRLPFFPIVSSGPNSANPHASPSDRKLFPGDLLVIDFGANVDGYFSDITRTFAIGEVDAEYQQIAEIVLASNQVGHAAAGPGVLASAIDHASRSLIESRGYGDFFIHRTGHGLGMEGHEEPYIRGDNDFALQPGMTFTIEPGIYLPNRNGVRIEDDVYITETGCQSFTNFPRELMRLG